MVKTPSGNKKLQILPLPPEYSPAQSDLFASHGAHSFFFFNPQKSTDLWELSLYHPMGSSHYLGETWTRIPLPDLRSIHQIQDMAYARGMIFLSGVDENRTPILRSYLLSPNNTGNSTQRVVSHTDFYPLRAEPLCGNFFTTIAPASSGFSTTMDRSRLVRTFLPSIALS